jgi:hypothetical protein
MSKKNVRTIVSFSDNAHKHSVPDLVLYINTDTRKLCFNKEGSVYVISCTSSNEEVNSVEQS